ncbi:MAG: type II secretion system protein N [Deltaproteobacteria bacterium]
MNLKRFLLLGNILLSGLILWVGVSIVTTWASSRSAGDEASALPAKAAITRELTPSKGKRAEDYSLIASKDVFHTTKETAKGAGKGQKSQAEEIKVTELNLELKGTVVGDGKDSYAFIMDKGSRKEEVYYANDYVMGAQILRIAKGRIILSVDGREEALLMLDESRTLPEMGSGGEKAEAITPAEQKPSSQGTTPPQRRVIPPRRGVGKTG